MAQFEYKCNSFLDGVCSRKRRLIHVSSIPKSDSRLLAP